MKNLYVAANFSRPLFPVEIYEPLMGIGTLSPHAADEDLSDRSLRWLEPTMIIETPALYMYTAEPGHAELTYHDENTERRWLQMHIRGSSSEQTRCAFVGVAVFPHLFNLEAGESLTLRMKLRTGPDSDKLGLVTCNMDYYDDDVVSQAIDSGRNSLESNKYHDVAVIVTYGGGDNNNVKYMVDGTIVSRKSATLHELNNMWIGVAQRQESQEDMIGMGFSVADVLISTGATAGSYSYWTSPSITVFDNEVDPAKTVLTQNGVKVWRGDADLVAPIVSKGVDGMITIQNKPNANLHSGALFALRVLECKVDDLNLKFKYQDQSYGYVQMVNKVNGLPYDVAAGAPSTNVNFGPERYPMTLTTTFSKTA